MNRVQKAVLGALGAFDVTQERRYLLPKGERFVPTRPSHACPYGTRWNGVRCVGTTVSPSLPTSPGSYSATFVPGGGGSGTSTSATFVPSPPSAAMQQAATFVPARK